MASPLLAIVCRDVDLSAFAMAAWPFLFLDCADRVRPHTCLVVLGGAVYGLMLVCYFIVFKFYLITFVPPEGPHGRVVTLGSARCLQNSSGLSAGRFGHRLRRCRFMECLRSRCSLPPHPQSLCLSQSLRFASGGSVLALRSYSSLFVICPHWRRLSQQESARKSVWFWPLTF